MTVREPIPRDHIANIVRAEKELRHAERAVDEFETASARGQWGDCVPPPCAGLVWDMGAVPRAYLVAAIRRALWSVVEERRQALRNMGVDA